MNFDVSLKYHLYIPKQRDTTSDFADIQLADKDVLSSMISVAFSHASTWFNQKRTVLLSVKRGQ